MKTGIMLTVTVAVAMAMASLAQAAMLTNEGITATQVTAVNFYNASGVHMNTANGNWWLDWATANDAEVSVAAISWNLPATRGNTYDFSGAEISFTAGPPDRIAAVTVYLRKSGTDVWTSNGQLTAGPYSWTVPTSLAYNGIDEIQFIFSGQAYGYSPYSVDVENGYGSSTVFSSNATPTPIPEPATLTLLALLGLGGLLLRRRQ